MNWRVLTGVAVVIIAVSAHKSSHGSVVHGHDIPCLHDEKQSTYHVAHQNYRFDVKSVGRIRVGIFTLDLDNPAKYCTQTGGTSPDFQGNTATCSASDVFDATKKAKLINDVIPFAVNRIANALSVERVVGNLNLNGSKCASVDLTVPASHATDGVPGVDFVLYVTAGPSQGAWAGMCTVDGNGRPIAGHINVGPVTLTYDQYYSEVLVQGIVTHELFHAFGFQRAYMMSDNWKGTVKPPIMAGGTIRGHTADLYIGESVLTHLRDFYDCPSLEAIDLENEGPTSTQGNHWDRRTLKDDVLASTGGTVMSVAILGALEDSGHYTINWDAAEPMKWGEGAGCGFVTETCDTVAGGRGKYFCFDNEHEQCTFTRDAIGSCAVGKSKNPVPTWGQYYDDPAKIGTMSFMDYCPVVQYYANRVCSDPNPSAPPDPLFGYYFGPGGVCFDTWHGSVGWGVLEYQWTHIEEEGNRCLQSQCSYYEEVQVTVNHTEWLTCPYGKGGYVELDPLVANYEANITCPESSDLCDAVSYSIFGDDIPTPRVVIQAFIVGTHDQYGDWTAPIIAAASSNIAYDVVTVLSTSGLTISATDCGVLIAHPCYRCQGKVPTVIVDFACHIAAEADASTTASHLQRTSGFDLPVTSALLGNTVRFVSVKTAASAASSYFALHGSFALWVAIIALTTLW